MLQERTAFLAGREANPFFHPRQAPAPTTELPARLAKPAAQPAALPPPMPPIHLTQVLSALSALPTEEWNVASMPNAPCCDKQM